MQTDNNCGIMPQLDDTSKHVVIQIQQNTKMLFKATKKQQLLKAQGCRLQNYIGGILICTVQPYLFILGP